CSLRVCVGGLPSCLNVSSLSAFIPSRLARRISRETPGGSLMYRIGSPAVRSLTPACVPGRKPLDHSRAEIACTCSVFELLATITTNVGRFSLSEPRPYEVHAPRHGRPVIWLPDCMSVIAGSWLIASVCMLRINTRSSTDFFRFGNSSLIHIPDWPTRSNRYIDG